MEEEPGDNELEERMYAAIHYAEDTQNDVNTNNKSSIPNFDNAPNSTMRRYWRTSENKNTPYSKVNSLCKNDTPKQVSNKKNVSEKTVIIPKDEKIADLSMLQGPVSDNVKKTIEIIENEDENRTVELESSEEDEVVEVVLPPKPTITIESSDEDEIKIISKPITESVDKLVELNKSSDKSSQNTRDSTSPVPSVVSSISDEFIRSDCLALNITSQNSKNTSLDFSLHGSDLEKTPSKKKRKKKSKDSSSTPLSTVSNKTQNSTESLFATPKSKAKNKRQRTKSYQVSECIIPNADVYDSDSNQSLVESVKSQTQYTDVSDKSLLNTDIYETDSNQSEKTKSPSSNVSNGIVSNVNSSEDRAAKNTTTPKKKNSISEVVENIVDLTKNTANIDENIVIGNVTGFPTIDLIEEESSGIPSKCGSSKIPAILYEDLDFDHFKSNRVSSRRQYSLTSLRAEMDKFYNESWGGEEFNHREILKNMSRDKNLWIIDPKDRMPALAKRKVTCSFCNRVGHKDDVCRMKPPICFMCGSIGHFEPRCPKKMCVNCGTPNRVYTNICRHCSNWHTMRCAECGQNGHPASHCPDIWRRYHDTTHTGSHLEENRQTKKHNQLFCSGCSRKGHLVHTCRLSLPFSGLPIFSPYVSIYRPVYNPTNMNSHNAQNQRNKQSKNKNSQQDDIASSTLTLKRQSKSPCNNDAPKKRNLGPMEHSENISFNNQLQKKNVQKEKKQVSDNKEQVEDNKDINKTIDTNNIDKAPDFIAVRSNNHDKKGQIIQDNEVSDTSEVVTSARVYVTKEIGEKLMSQEGGVWLKETGIKNNITIETSEINMFLSIKGTVGNQEAFQTELRDWIQNTQRDGRKISECESNVSQAEETTSAYHMIPKKRHDVLRKIKKALESLNQDIGDPNALYKELIFLQNKHKQLLKQKVISSTQLSINKNKTNGMLKKLNMILLGQAGLGNGSQHLNKLYAFQEKLINLRQKTLAKSFREEIGGHFCVIFTPIPRDDYVDLLNKYYSKKRVHNFKKKSPLKSFKGLKMCLRENVAENDLQNNFSNDVSVKDTQNLRNGNGNLSKVNRIEKAKNKLILFYNQLSHINPVSAVLNKNKNNLERDLHISIAILRRRSDVSNKLFKKISKIQEQVKKFLSSI